MHSSVYLPSVHPSQEGYDDVCRAQQVDDERTEALVDEDAVERRRERVGGAVDDEHEPHGDGREVELAHVRLQRRDEEADGRRRAHDREGGHRHLRDAQRGAHALAAGAGLEGGRKGEKERGCDYVALKENIYLFLKRNKEHIKVEICLDSDFGDLSGAANMYYGSGRIKGPDIFFSLQLLLRRCRPRWAG